MKPPRSSHTIPSREVCSRALRLIPFGNWTRQIKTSCRWHRSITRPALRPGGVARTGKRWTPSRGKSTQSHRARKTGVSGSGCVVPVRKHPSHSGNFVCHGLHQFPAPMRPVALRLGFALAAARRHLVCHRGRSSAPRRVGRAVLCAPPLARLCLRSGSRPLRLGFAIGAARPSRRRTRRTLEAPLVAPASRSETRFGIRTAARARRGNSRTALAVTRQDAYHPQQPIFS